MNFHKTIEELKCQIAELEMHIDNNRYQAKRLWDKAENMNDEKHDLEAQLEAVEAQHNEHIRSMTERMMKTREVA